MISLEGLYKHKVIVITVGVIILLLILYIAMFSSPSGFPTGEIVLIEEGQTVGEVAETLKQKEIIKSILVFKVLVRIQGGDSGVLSGEYLLNRRMSVFSISRIMTDGDYGIEPIKILVPEGLSNKEVADLLESKLPKLDNELFIQLAADKEGFLFPDTYFVLPTTSEEEMIDIMNDNFNEKILTLASIDEWGRDYNDVIIMASLLEKEARRMETRKKIAGILWKRLDSGMALQVDATFIYFLGKSSLELTLEDLKYDSPYNTYKYVGLPPGPIANPGLDSITAAIYYEETPYWFYLSDDEGITHYAATFEEHKANKAKYLR